MIWVFVIDRGASGGGVVRSDMGRDGLGGHVIAVEVLAGEDGPSALGKERAGVNPS